ncbi:MAG: hypothetical protein LBI62_07075 [Candidatus Accumulibacter sp.]|nr:hypothetical protein [Accumulibacter sp.]
MNHRDTETQRKPVSVFAPGLVSRARRFHGSGFSLRLCASVVKGFPVFDHAGSETVSKKTGNGAFSMFTGKTMNHRDTETQRKPVSVFAPGLVSRARRFHGSGFSLCLCASVVKGFPVFDHAGSEAVSRKTGNGAFSMFTEKTMNHRDTETQRKPVSVFAPGLVSRARRFHGSGFSLRLCASMVKGFPVFDHAGSEAVSRKTGDGAFSMFTEKTMNHRDTETQRKPVSVFAPGLVSRARRFHGSGFSLCLCASVVRGFPVFESVGT